MTITCEGREGHKRVIFYLKQRFIENHIKNLFSKKPPLYCARH